MIEAAEKSPHMLSTDETQEASGGIQSKPESLRTQGRKDEMNVVAPAQASSSSSNFRSPSGLPRVREGRLLF